jgi:hypothetical protein
MGKKNYVLGHYDRYVVTGFGQCGTLPHGAMVWVSEKESVITIDVHTMVRRPIRGQENCVREFELELRLFPFFSPHLPLWVINEKLLLLGEGSFDTAGGHHLLEQCNLDLMFYVQTQAVRPNLVFVLDLPVSHIREGILLGDSRSKEPGRKRRKNE